MDDEEQKDISRKGGEASGGGRRSEGNEVNQQSGTGSRRGLASADEETRQRVSSEGGRAAHQKGTAHEFDSEEAREAGRKGGESVSRNREHMSEIGRKGGEKSRGGGR
jgi:general stress protein YciG